jgi:hypothetical protein
MAGFARFERVPKGRSPFLNATQLRELVHLARYPLSRMCSVRPVEEARHDCTENGQQHLSFPFTPGFRLEPLHAVISLVTQEDGIPSAIASAQAVNDHVVR